MAGAETFQSFGRQAVKLLDAQGSTAVLFP